MKEELYRKELIYLITHFLVKTFIKDKNNRSSYGFLTSIVGIVCNVILFVVKFILGIITNSISLTADSFNNLSDVGSSLVTLFGFFIASKPADKEHPFGHGRTEYISALIVSLLIIVLGIELIHTSINKIIQPVEINFNWTIFAILLLTIIIKVWLSHFNKDIGTMINSQAIKAVSLDAMGDVLATSIVTISLVISQFISIPIDGYFGVIVALFIIFNGLKTAKETLDMLLGEKTDPQLIKKLKQFVLHFEGIKGIHDLIIHDYGPTIKLATLHAEIPSEYSSVVAHEIIDEVERKVFEEMEIYLVIHLDPIDFECKYTKNCYAKVKELLSELQEIKSIHDFRIVNDVDINTMIFDIVVDEKISQQYIYILKSRILTKLQENFDNYQFIITMDRENLYT